MPNGLDHLSAPLVISEPARFTGGGQPKEQEEKNKTHRKQHANYLGEKRSTLTEFWENHREERQARDLPELPAGIPLLLKIDPNEFDLEFLRSFDFEIVSENERGFIIVASEDSSLKKFQEKINGFAEGAHGSGTAAKLYEIIEPTDIESRIEAIVVGDLKEKITPSDNDEIIVADFSIECLGPSRLPAPPIRKETEDEDKYQERVQRWEKKRTEIQMERDDLQVSRENEIQRIISAYGGEILRISQDADSAIQLPDSFTLRARLSIEATRDIALNYPYVFEISGSELFQYVHAHTSSVPAELEGLTLHSPNEEDPYVCIIDSGIQEEHILLRDAIDTPSSRSWVPGDENDTADYVSPNGHGTRVAGRVLFPDGEINGPEVHHRTWIRNARILDNKNSITKSVLPEKALAHIVDTYTRASPPTKIFNHSINSYAPCRLRHMSSWAAQIDYLCWQHDICIIQSAGNISEHSTSTTSPGVSQYINSGKPYPTYLTAPSARIRNPSQSLQALTVGSISSSTMEDLGEVKSLGEKSAPSGFTTTGLGIWDSVKPEVVEHGGDFATNGEDQPTLTTPEEVCPNLVRSTMHSVGPPMSRDEVGTSFAAPKVAALAAALQRLFPDETALLYRALIINSARWPSWTDGIEDKKAILRQIGYGVPDEYRATENDTYRATLITNGERRIETGQAHIFRVPIPKELRGPAVEANVRIDITLSYSALPRRTRRFPRHYLSTWLDWQVSKKGETYESFENRIIKQRDNTATDGEDPIPWMLRERGDWGEIPDVRRNVGTVQKDWARLKGYELPTDLCIAVRAHKGWDPSPDAYAKYALAITIEAEDQDIEIYYPVTAAVQEVTTEVHQTV